MIDKPTLNGAPLIHERMPDAEAVPEEALRRMNHAEWLGQFSVVLDTPVQGRPTPMTPFRMGAITRLKLAARYIALLEADVVALQKRIKDDGIEDCPEGR